MKVTTSGQNFLLEGFWKSKDEPHFPKPKPDCLTQEKADAYADALQRIQKKAKISLFKGDSYSRITKEKLGNKEYTYGGWKWPGDFSEHYIRQHRVKPSPEFREFLKPWIRR